MGLRKSSSSASNRRNLERFSLSMPSNISAIYNELPEQTLPTSNISSGGVFFQTDNIYPVGTVVRVNISLEPDSTSTVSPAAKFRVEGTVIRNEPDGMAIAFDISRVTGIKVPPSKKGRLGPAMVGIVGPDPLMNDLLATRLTQDTGVNCCHSPSLEKILETANPDITLINCADISTQEFLEDINGAQSPCTKTNLALFNVTENRSIELQALNLGIRGLFNRHSSYKLLIKGISAILDDELWFSREAMSAYLLGKQQQSTEVIAPVQQEDTWELSVREQEILKMLAGGASNKDIADSLFLSLNTVKSHIYNIYRKIDVPNRLQASLWASKHLRREARAS